MIQICSGHVISKTALGNGVDGIEWSCGEVVT